MSENQYPLFLPPEELAQKGRMNWSAPEADSYLQWMVGSLDSRTKQFLLYLGDLREASPETLLDQVGVRLAELLPQPQFSHGAPAKPELTNEGQALVCDAGLLVAQLLLKACPKLCWNVVRRPKTDVSYNLPVLTGFGGRMTLDPVGGAIAESYALLRGQRKSDVWRRIFEFWRDQAQILPPTA